MAYYNIHGVIVSTDIVNKFLNDAFYKRYKNFIVSSSDNCDLRIDELHILELFDYTNDYNFKSYKTNDNCAYLNKFEDIIIWKKNQSQIYFSITTQKDSMVAYIWLTRSLDCLLFEHYGLLHVHCSCLSNNDLFDRASIFCGQSGSGKSTIALKMIEQGNKLIAEDNLYIKILNNNVIAYSNTSPIKMRKDFNLKNIAIKYGTEYDVFFKKTLLFQKIIILLTKSIYYLIEFIYWIAKKPLRVPLRN